MSKEVFEFIYRKYYTAILKYCNMRLQNDFYAAEDCAQEVFLVLLKKLPKLMYYDNLGAWLYRTADIVMKNYRKKHPETTDIDTIPEIPEELPPESILDELTQEERELLEAYYNGEDKIKLAGKNGMTLKALYVRIMRIKNKLKEKLK